jgi:hypothetical protein
LHGGGYGDERVTVGYGFKSAVGRAHAELGGAYGDLLVGDCVLAAGLDGYVETFVFVKTFDQGGVEAAVFGLGVPVGLQNYFGESGRLGGRS